MVLIRSWRRSRSSQLAQIRDQIGPVAQWLGDADAVGVPQVADALGEFGDTAASVTEDLTSRVGGASDPLSALPARVNVADSCPSRCHPSAGSRSAPAARVTLPDGAAASVVCNAAGQLVEVVRPGGARYRYDRDRLGRVVRVTGP